MARRPHRRAGVDPGRLGVAGCSAGGALAASVALMARDRNGPRLALQLLTFPVTDDRMDTPSARSFHDTPSGPRRSPRRCGATTSAKGTSSGRPRRTRRRTAPTTSADCRARTS
ncbi:alpha/beta hydrolase fold domain-containing protein [Streptomyces nogalater]